MKKNLKIISLFLFGVIILYLILYIWNIYNTNPQNILLTILGTLIFLFFPGIFLSFLFFEKKTNFEIIGINFLINFIFYSLLGLIFLYFGLKFNYLLTFWTIIVATILISICFVFKKFYYSNPSTMTDNDIDIKNELPFARAFPIIITIIITVSIISRYIIYLFNFPFIYGDLWVHGAKINSILNGSLPPQSLFIGVPGDTSYPSWMTYLYISLGNLIINLPTYQTIFLLTFFEVLIPLLFFNFFLNCLLKKNESFFKIKTLALIFFAFFSGFGGIIVILVYFLMPGIYITQGPNFLKAIGIFTGDIFGSLRVSGYLIQAFAIGILFWGIGLQLKKLKDNNLSYTYLALFAIISSLLMQIHYEICLLFFIFLFVIFLPLYFNNKPIKFVIKRLLFLIILTVLSTLFINYLFANTVNLHINELFLPIIEFISHYFPVIHLFTPYLIEILIIFMGVFSLFIILVVKGSRIFINKFENLKDFIIKHISKIRIILLLIYGFLFIFWIYKAMDFVLDWTSGQLPLYLIPTSMGFALLFTIFGIGIKKPIDKNNLTFLNAWIILFFILGFSLEYFTFTYTSIQTRIIIFIIPIIDVLAACYLAYLLKNQSFWKKIKLNHRVFKSAFILIIICCGSLSYLFSVILQCQRGLNNNSKLSTAEIQSLDWIRENTPEDSCIFSLEQIIDDGIMLIAQRYIPYWIVETNLITTNNSVYFWLYFDNYNVTHILINWDRDFTTINNLNNSYFEILITTTNTSIIYSFNNIKIYSVDLLRIEFLD